MLEVVIVGLGTIGGTVAEALHRGLPNTRLAGIAGRSPKIVERVAQRFGREVPAGTLLDVVGKADVVVDCAASSAFVEVAETALAHGKSLVTVNAATLLDRMDLVERAAARGLSITVATGALAGFDAVRAAAEGEIRSVSILTRKAPRALAGAPHVRSLGLDLAGLRAPFKLFSGTVREAARSFPDNVNVAAGLSLAGIGPDRTIVEIWADPTVERNIHRIEVEADSTRFSIQIEGVPSPQNPRTGLLTPNSVIACLRGRTGGLRVGS